MPMFEELDGTPLYVASSRLLLLVQKDSIEALGVRIVGVIDGGGGGADGPNCGCEGHPVWIGHVVFVLHVVLVAGDGTPKNCHASAASGRQGQDAEHRSLVG